MANDELKHVGVKGMRWGVRRASSKSSGGSRSPNSTTKRNSKRLAKVKRVAKKKIKDFRKDEKAQYDAKLAAAKLLNKSYRLGLIDDRQLAKGAWYLMSLKVP